MIRYKVYTNIGNRDINEDNVGAALNGDSLCFVVADGLGGHGNGEIASKLATDAVCISFIEAGFSDSFFEKVFEQAQKNILNEQRKQFAFSKMKTTIVNLIIHNDKAQWAHIGDSRLYMFRKNKVKKRTLDHSVPQMLALAGNIKDEEIRNHPDRNRLMRVLGVQGEMPRLEISDIYKLSYCQAFLLCTDGFWELIDENMMCKLLKESTSPDEWIEKMVNVIKNNGKNVDMDNYTAIAVFNDRFKGRWFGI